jgi:hypothetical protein
MLANFSWVGKKRGWVVRYAAVWGKWREFSWTKFERPITWVYWVRFDSPVFLTGLKFRNHMISVWLCAPCVSFLPGNENRGPNFFKHPKSQFYYVVFLRPSGGARIKGFLFSLVPFSSVARASTRLVVTLPNDVTNNMCSCHYLFDVGCRALIFHSGSFLSFLFNIYFFKSGNRAR